MIFREENEANHRLHRTGFPRHDGCVRTRRAAGSRSGEAGRWSL